MLARQIQRHEPPHIIHKPQTVDCRTLLPPILEHLHAVDRVFKEQAPAAADTGVQIRSRGNGESKASTALPLVRSRHKSEETHLLPGVALFNEVLHLHLLELTGAEDEVPRGDLIPERLAHLGDPEGDLRIQCNTRQDKTRQDTPLFQTKQGTPLFKTRQDTPLFASGEEAEVFTTTNPVNILEKKADPLFQNTHTKNKTRSAERASERCKKTLQKRTTKNHQQP